MIDYPLDLFPLLVEVMMCSWLLPTKRYEVNGEIFYVYVSSLFLFGSLGTSLEFPEFWEETAMTKF